MKKEIVIPLKPRDLGDVDSAISTYLNNIIGTCTETDGYITRITKSKVISNIISRIQPTVFVKVKYTYENFNPTIGNMLDCDIKMMFQDGIWTEKTVDGVTICVAIPKNNVKMVWDGKRFGTLKLGDNVRVRITNVNFDGSIKKYIGTL